MRHMMDILMGSDLQTTSDYSLNEFTLITPEAEESAEDNTCTLFTFIVFSVTIGLICLFGVAGNILSYIVLWKHKTETSTIFLLQCMAVMDFLLLVCFLFVYSFPAVYPYTGTMQVFNENFPIVATYIWPAATMLHTATILLTVLVTFNRYNAVCRAVEEFGTRSLSRTKRHVTILILFSVIYNTPRLFEHKAISVSRASSSNNSSQFDENGTLFLEDTTGSGGEETSILGDNQIYQIIYANLLYFAVMYVIPLVALAYLNSKLIFSLNQVKKKALKSGRKVKEDNITHCVVAIVCVFFITQTPALLNQIFWATFEAEDRDCGRFHFYYTKLSDVLVVFNSSCNFVVYCMFGRTFRRIFISTICCRGPEGTQGVRAAPSRARYSQVDTQLVDTRTVKTTLETVLSNHKGGDLTPSGPPPAALGGSAAVSELSLPVLEGDGGSNEEPKSEGEGVSSRAPSPEDVDIGALSEPPSPTDIISPHLILNITSDEVIGIDDLEQIELISDETVL